MQDMNLAPTDLDLVLSPNWLTHALTPVSGGAAVAEIDIVETITTVATKVRFKVNYRSGAPAGAPREFCIKGFFGPEAAFAVKGGVMATEAAFYRDLGPKIPGLRIVPTIYAEDDPDAGHGVLVMNDLIARGDRFLSALQPFSADQVSRTLEQIACLNAAQWGLPRNGSATPWAASRLRFFLGFQAVPASMLTEFMAGPRGDRLPSELRSGSRMYAGLHALDALVSSEAACLVHGDAHAGNVYERPDGTPGLIDWQLLQTESWALDVAYHVGAVLSIEDRRKNERALLLEYVRRLRSSGVEAPSDAHAWDLYRAALVYGFFLWGITRKVDPVIVEEFVTRLGTAVADHESLDLLSV